MVNILYFQALSEITLRAMIIQSVSQSILSASETVSQRFSLSVSQSVS